MADASFVAAPEWTEYTQRSGLDPLGMQNTSVALYQKLLPGISNVTLRMRYYGLYAWLAREYARRFGDTNPRTWQRFVRRSEALYALIAQRLGSERGVAGTNWAARKLSEGYRQIPFGTDADPGSTNRYLKQAWGAYGAAYSSQLYEIGIFAPAEGHSIPVPSAEIGDELARAFSAAIGPLAKRFIATLQDGDVGLEDLDAFAPMVPSAIEPDGDEHALYRDLLFAQAGLTRSSDKSRRDSLLLVLALTNRLAQAPSVHDIRWGLYAGRLPNGQALILPDNLERQRRRWWIYQVNDLSHICFEALLKLVLSTLEREKLGLTPSRLVAETTSAILKAAGNRPESWSNFLESTELAANAWSDESDHCEYRLCEAVMQAAGERGGGPDEAWAALKLLASIHNRVRAVDVALDDELGGFDPLAFRSALTEIEFLDRNADAPFQRTLERLIEERVIGRHLSVAMRKLRFQGDYTFLVENDEGRLRFRNMDGPVFTNPRLGPALTFLSDLHLLDHDGLTPRGSDLITSAAA